MASTTISEVNVNLGLRHLTIDDLIMGQIPRHLLQSLTQEEYEAGYRQQYGERVFGGKVVVVRSDLNTSVKKSPEGFYIIDGKSDRIILSAQTIGELAGYGAKVVVLAHQGREKEEKCISLEPHRKSLEAELRKPIIFEKGVIWGERLENIIRSMKDGEIFLVDNVRRDSAELREVTDPEEFARTPDSYMAALNRLADIYVNDAFSTSHRAHASIIGFPSMLNIAGRLFEREIETHMELIKSTRHPYVAVFGGLKVDGYITYLEKALERGFVDTVLSTGLLGIMGHMAKARGRKGADYFGRQTRELLEKQGVVDLLPNLKEIIGENPDRIILPSDFRVRLGDDIFYATPDELKQHPERNKITMPGLGRNTVRQFLPYIDQGDLIYLKGSPTLDEHPYLEEAKSIVERIVKRTHAGAVTVVSGGDTTLLVGRLGFSPVTDFSKSTPAGGASMEYQAGLQLPGLIVLHSSYCAFHGIAPEHGLPNGIEPEIRLVAPKIGISKKYSK